MVKPPKTMQPESFDLAKAGRKSGRSFQQDSHHQYMARKIDLQRQQFGLLLPPAPQPKSPKTTSASRKRLRSSPSPSQGTHGRPKSVSFAALPLTQDIRFLDEDEEDEDEMDGDLNQTVEESGGMSAILKKLKRRHGKGRRRLLRKAKRQRCRRDEDIATGTSTDALLLLDGEPEDSDELFPDPSSPEGKIACTPSNDDSSQQSVPETDLVCAASTVPSPLQLRRERPDLFFLGVVVKVNGYTYPDNETLKRLLQQHGGDFETYETERVTHIVAEHLSTAKAQHLQKQKRPRPVVRPAWIVDSVQAQRLLPHGDYLLEELFQAPPSKRDGTRQIGIKDMFGSLNSPQKRKRNGDYHACTRNKERMSESLDYYLQSDSGREYGMDFPRKTDASVTNDKCEQEYLAQNIPTNHRCGPNGHWGASVVDELISDGNAGASPNVMVSDTNGLLLSLTPQRDHTGMEETAELAMNEFPLTQIEQEPLETDSDGDTEPLDEHKSPMTKNVEPSTKVDMIYIREAEASEDSVAAPPLVVEPIEPPETANDLEEAIANTAPPEAEPSVVTTNAAFEKVLTRTPQGKGGMKGPGMCWTEETRTQLIKSPASAATLSKTQGRTDAKYINGQIRTVGTDPNFLKSFFSNSRLSFIGSYKQRTNEVEIGSPQRHLRSRTEGKGQKRFVFHVDMDCFFANVVLRKFPQYRDRPVAISHHGKRKQDEIENGEVLSGDSTVLPVSAKSTSECATCNYHARKFGIKKGMFLGRAKQLCPKLVVLSYDFAGYEEVSDQVLTILHRTASEYQGCVEAVSCDEAYMELHLSPPPSHFDSSSMARLEDKAGEIAELLRKEILETTQCTASVGVASNKFLAKVGTDRVKPNGTFVVGDYREVLEKLRLRDLYGIGYRSEPKLADEGLDTVQDVWDLGSSAESILGRILGPGLGKKIFDFCRGHDDREVKAAERKTIGAECNYGVRFDGSYGIDHFMADLTTEIQKRMEGIGVKGTKLTLKVKQRKKGAKPPPKFLGHGSCHNLSRSMEVPGSVPTRDSKIFCDVGMTLFRELGIPLDDVRGMGIVLSKLLSDPSRSITGTPSASIANIGMSTWLEKAPKLAPLCDGALIEGGDMNIPDNEGEADHRATSQAEDAEWVLAENMVVDIENTSAQGDDEFQDLQTNDLALPPLSQICMSQVAALPPELQQEIHTRMADLRERDANLPPVTGILPTSSVVAEASIAASRSNTRDFPPSITDSEKNHFRQTNLKRMMKLAAVKSGQTRTEMALSQLEHLPLELKLQIVNQDSDPLGRLSQHPRSSRDSSIARHSRTTKWSASRANSSIILPKGKSIVDIDLMENLQRTECAVAARLGDEVISATTEDQTSEEPEMAIDLFEDDIVPLQHFLDENSPLDLDAVNMVSIFLKTCLKEKRLNTAVALFRSMRKRRDKWSERSVLLDFANALNEGHFEKYGYHLDLEYLIGG